jgi:hypothetical protein
MGSSFSYAQGTAIPLKYETCEKHGEEPSRFIEVWIDVFHDMA